MDKTFLFCLPFAGGNKYSYRPYEAHSPDFLKVVPLEYPGRGARINEPLITSTDFLLEDLYSQLAPFLLKKIKYGIYGHSMGGLMACLLARKIVQHDSCLPRHVFITGAIAPAASSRMEKKRHLLNKKDFLEEIRNLKGSPDEILANEELLEYFEPILRADFKASETYRYQEFEPLEVPFTVINGTEEDATADEIQLWQKETSLPVDFHYRKGNHFFIFDDASAIVNIIANKLSDIDNQSLTWPQ